ncbi:HNH endonuclease signature motif containing protein [Blastococcus sp. URHD0036]|uniref:HNH endonuclease signature motif containing protein n=1 Tax=Blastococcus sp. URHD0036 TaxID=1380356 RepID=UPI0004950F24|nr:HNH endonuclease signature motif containing protein [Blastococcus sp. URHD0036]
MGELQSALDALAAVDLDELSDGPLLDHVRELAVAQNRLGAALTRAVRRADVRAACEHDGAKTMQSWLRGHLRVSGGLAKDLVGHGRALESLPATEAAFAAGDLGADQVGVITEIVKPANLDLAAEQGIDIAEVEAALVTVALHGSHRDLQLACGDYLAKLDPDGPEPDPTEERAFTMVQHADGTWTVHGTLDPVGGQKLATALESTSAASRCAGDTRSRAQRDGDALVQLADNALASGQLPVLRTVKPHVIVTIGIDDLVDPATGHGAATTGLGATISAARARWAACDSTITRIVLDPDGLPIDVGRDHRVVPAHIRKAVELRDKKCVFAGCEAPRWYCDVHHIIEWMNGGRTSVGNSALLCERHHGKVHHGYRIERDDTAPPGQRWRTYRPDGTEIIVGRPLLT